MLNNQTIDHLYKMRLASMAVAWTEQVKDPKICKLSFDERFGLLVEAEHLARYNRRLKSLLKQAELRVPGACIEDVATGASLGLEKARLRDLATCGWIEQRLNLLLSGATGVGKTYLACALAQMACRRGLKVKYRRLPRLFDELALAKADGTYTKELAKLAKLNLLVLDDFGLKAMQEPQRHDLLEILEDRYDRSSTIVTSQLPFEKWHDAIRDPTTADALLDRLVHNSHKIKLKGPSRRKEKTSRRVYGEDAGISTHSSPQD